jgi:hypothetical protein
MNEVTTIPDGDMIMRIIDRASTAPEFDLGRLEKLLDLKDRWDRAEAQRAFAIAKVAFKRDAPVLHKNKTVSFGQTSYMHATHDEVTSKISTALAKHGFSHAWSMSQDNANKITVKCTLTHVGGHSESVELSSAPDQSGGKNSIQAIASATNYLQRYTLIAVTGMSVAEADDDDGRTSDVQVPLLQEVWAELHAASERGTAALAEAWKGLSDANRAIIVLHYQQRWADTKAYAGSVPKFTEAATQ